MKKLLLGLVALTTFLKTPMTTVEIPLVETRIKTEVTETEVETETDYVYVICDVVDNYDTDITNLVCKMPNGKNHIYTIEDAPEGKIKLVCFRTENQDDYTVYEVVAVR